MGDLLHFSGQAPEELVSAPGTVYLDDHLLRTQRLLSVRTKLGWVDRDQVNTLYASALGHRTAGAWVALSFCEFARGDYSHAYASCEEALRIAGPDETQVLAYMLDLFPVSPRRQQVMERCARTHEHPSW